MKYEQTTKPIGALAFSSTALAVVAEFAEMKEEDRELLKVIDPDTWHISIGTFPTSSGYRFVISSYIKEESNEGNEGNDVARVIVMNIEREKVRDVYRQAILLEARRLSMQADS